MLNDIQEVIVIAGACKNDSESFHILAVGPSIFFPVWNFPKILTRKIVAEVVLNREEEDKGQKCNGVEIWVKISQCIK